eukprot:gb/GECH01003552.1/.p1 GENE.gb/GECH01003552.1/~~gb/GECH01003552.1/.p1  ORF type:complete len:106 (+),score=17.81 gb/GECH01003552.1/:1-318(+)
MKVPNFVIKAVFSAVRRHILPQITSRLERAAKEYMERRGTSAMGKNFQHQKKNAKSSSTNTKNFDHKYTQDKKSSPTKHGSLKEVVKNMLKEDMKSFSNMWNKRK